MESKKTVSPVIKDTDISVPEKTLGKIEIAREFAYSLYVKRGYALGNELQVWLDFVKKTKSIRESKEKKEKA